MIASIFEKKAIFIANQISKKFTTEDKLYFYKMREKQGNHQASKCVSFLIN